MSVKPLDVVNPLRTIHCDVYLDSSIVVRPEVHGIIKSQEVGLDFGEQWQVPCFSDPLHKTNSSH